MARDMSAIKLHDREALNPEPSFRRYVQTTCTKVRSVPHEREWYRGCSEGSFLAILQRSVGTLSLCNQFVLALDASESEFGAGAALCGG